MAVTAASRALRDGIRLDRIEFADFVEATEPRLRRALIAHFGPDRGREATAEALAWAWEHRGRLEQLTNPLAYLYRVGQTRTRRRRLLLMGLRRDPPAELTPEPRLLESLRKLSDRQRVCVVLVHGYAWTLAEVAELLDVEVSTVQTHTERGLQRLRVQLGADSQ